MRLRKVREHNDEEFIKNFKSVRSIVLYASTTQDFFCVTKSEVAKMAENCKIRYYMANDIFANRRNVLVII